jgi:hypothetical protein
MANRITAVLKGNLENNLCSYATAAAAAGVGILAFAQSAQAKVIYTPTHKKIGNNVAIPLDLNNDGKADFNLSQRFTWTSSGEVINGSILAVAIRSENGVMGHSLNYFRYASALGGGVYIGPKKKFLLGKGLVAFGASDPESGGSICIGDWVNVKHHYLGLKFVINKEVHFGWARLNESCVHGDNTAVLTGYAYETISNKPIIAGDEGTSPSLGHLALGAAGKK